MSRLNFLFGAFALACILVVIQGQLEKCHTNILTPHHFLDLNRYQGKWYAIKIAPSKAHQVWPLNYTCLTIDYKASQDNKQVDIVEYYKDNETGKNADIASVARLDELELPLPSKWQVYYTEPGTNETLITQAVVLAADEDEWAIEYGCGIRQGELYERIAVYSRKRTLDPVIDKVLTTIAFGIGFPYDNFRSINQTQC